VGADAAFCLIFNAIPGFTGQICVSGTFKDKKTIPFQDFQEFKDKWKA